jgi:hypothetical protein
MQGKITEVNFGPGALDSETVRATLNGRVLLHPKHGRGVLERDKDGALLAAWNSGATARFTGELSRECRVELQEGDFEGIDNRDAQPATKSNAASEVMDTGPTRKPVALMSHDERVAAVMKCPEWARPAVAPIYGLADLWPRQTEADRRAARAAELRAIGAGVSAINRGGPAKAKPAAAQSAPAVRNYQNVPPGSEKRADQLRAIGKAASGRA